MQTTDPMEQIIELALIKAGFEYRTDAGGGLPECLDFYVPALGLFIEVKRFHSPRIAEQMARTENVIVAQGKMAVVRLAEMIEHLGHRSPRQRQRT